MTDTQLFWQHVLNWATLVGNLIISIGLLRLHKSLKKLKATQNPEFCEHEYFASDFLSELVKGKRVLKCINCDHLKLTDE